MCVYIWGEGEGACPDKLADFVECELCKCNWNAYSPFSMHSRGLQGVLLI